VNEGNHIDFLGTAEYLLKTDAVRTSPHPTVLIRSPDLHRVKPETHPIKKNCMYKKDAIGVKIIVLFLLRRCNPVLNRIKAI
jgi:hypothetical protein